MKLSLESFSGYLRNLKSLCREFDLPLAGDRRESEKQVILKAWEKWDTDAGNHLFGAFSFVIRNCDANELFCVRDQLGLEQLYYCLTGTGRILAASDILTIRNDPEYKTGIDGEALQTYLMFGYAAGEKTLFRGIRKLPPGCCLVFANGTARINPYYSFRFRPERGLSEDAWCDRIEETAKTVIAEDAETNAGKPSVSFLSSGVDSSWLLSLCGAGTAVSVGYGACHSDETTEAQETAKTLGRGFVRKIVTAEEYFDALPALCRGLEMPLADASSPAFCLGCREASRSADFCYSGEGPDEFFAGYRLYRRCAELALDGGPLHFGCFGLMAEETARELLGYAVSRFDGPGLVSRIYRDTADGEHLSRLLSIDIRLYFEGDILFNLSRNAKANGLTVAAPFADPRMLELSATIPSALKLRDGQGKYIFRKAAARGIPHQTAFREKKGFPIPLSDWMRNESIRERMEAVLFGSSSRMFFDQNLIRRWWSVYLSGNRSPSYMLYGIYLFLIWYETCYSLNLAGTVPV